MATTIDTEKAYMSRQHGDITAIYTWVNDERALVLVPTFRKGAPWFIVCESAAYKYDSDLYIAKQAIKACEVLGIEPIPQDMNVAEAKFFNGEVLAVKLG